MAVTEAAPLVAHINSMLRSTTLDEAKLPQSLESLIAIKGVVRTTGYTELHITTNDAERAAQHG